ncbi:MAG: TonB-dependent receptor, partial [Opitutaceae bacterium]|nr:TonB-dependent receptor [Opitutaceae bacterium]
RELTEGGLEAFAELGYRYSTYGAAYPGFLPAVTLSATHAFNPFRTGVAPGFVGKAVRILFDPTDLPDARTDSRQQAYRVVGGLKGKLSADNWLWSADLSWDMTDSRAQTMDYLRFLAPAVNAGIYNPLRDLSQQPVQTVPEREKYLSRRNSLSRPEVSTFNVRANGDLLDLPAGALALSLGTEGRFETDFSANDYAYGAYSTLPGASLTPSSRNDTFRRVLSGYTEIAIPLVGERNRLPALRHLEFSLAGRFESYDDFGEAYSPMLAGKMEPIKGITIRGSFSQGFLPPSQSSLYASVITGPPGTATFIDPLRPGLARGPITQTSGGNTGLDPETTDALDVGIILQPGWAPALTISATYYRYDTRDRIVSPSLQNIIDWEAIFPQRVQRATPTAADSAAGRPGLITGVDRTQMNVARLVTDGIDFRASYRISTNDSGAFTLAANGTAGLSYKTQAVEGAPFIDTQGDIGDGRSTYPPLDLRGQLSLRWEKSGYSAGWTGRYTSEYQTNSTRPTASAPNKTGYDGNAIDSTFEMDLQFSYRVPYQAASPSPWRRLLGGTQWTLGCLNVLDREPPYITTYLGWYSLFSDPRGRFVYLQLKKNF